MDPTLRAIPTDQLEAELEARRARQRAVPRRCHVDRLTPEELVLLEALRTIERMPAAAPLLTEAGTLLQQARDKLADYVDAQLAAVTP